MENEKLMPESIETDKIKKSNFLPVIAGLFVGVLVLSNILAVKMIQIGVFVFDGGTLLFPFSYILGDVLAEVYGHKTARKIIWAGFFMLIFTSLNIYLVSILPSEKEWLLQKEFDDILLQMPRITAGSLLGYLLGANSNSIVLSKLKVLTRGKHLWLRTIGSTVVGEFIDSIVFVAVAFLGLYGLPVLIVMAFSNYLFKTVIEVVFTPLTYKVIGFVKKREQIDVYEYWEKPSMY
ncbi:queuosine precursor transporter [Treponema pedis]|uniref:queuosine precursor transporter n=1 Tax=Treponema pedis TaxID=409322 RepID=UPI003D23828B